MYLKLRKFDVAKQIYINFVKQLEFFHRFLQQAFTSSGSFKISIESFNKKLTVNQQRELIDVSIQLVNYSHVA